MSMIAEETALACALCGYSLSGYTHNIKVGEVHEQCMIAFWYGITFRQQDGTIVKHNGATCGLCSVIYYPMVAGEAL